MKHDIVEHRGDKFVSLAGPDAHSTRLIPEQRSIQEKQLSNRSLVAAMDGRQQSRRRRITRGGEGFVVFTPRSVVALIHRILPSSVVIASASLTDAHQGVTSRVDVPSLVTSSRFFSPALPKARVASRARAGLPSVEAEIRFSPR